MPESECIFHKNIKFRSQTLEGLRVQELNHYRESNGKGNFGFHKCTYFEVYDDDGKMIGVDCFAHGLFDNFDPNEIKNV